MTTLGMDTDAARAASNELEGGADQISGLAHRLDGLLLGLEWTGHDAERVRASWQEQERHQLDVTAEHLRGLVAMLRREAEAQDHASGDGSGAAGGAVAPTQAQGLDAVLAAHLGAYLAGVGRSFESAGDLAGKIGDVLTGERAWSVAAVAASALTTLGSSVGAVWNGITGEDQHWFDERPGHAGEPTVVPTDPSRATQYQPALTPPTDLPSLMQGVSDGYQVGSAPGATGDVRITTVDNGSGRPTYVVAVPGTESWSPGAGGQPRDLTANLALVAGNPSAASESVERAMAAAGIPPGAQVLMVGHSQGGIIAAQLASDPAFVERYGVREVVTYGSPVDHVSTVPGVRLTQIQHGADLVPRLDLGGLRTDPMDPLPDRARTVTLDSPAWFIRPDINHSHTEYTQSVREARGADTEAGRTLRDLEDRYARPRRR